MKELATSDAGVLPDPSLGAPETADVEALELDEIAGKLGIEMQRGRARAPVGAGRAPPLIGCRASHFQHYIYR